MVSKAMNFLAILAKYLPYVLAGVVSVEQTIGASPGASKKQVVLDALAAAGAVGEQVPETHIKVISALINSVVGSLNVSGVFTHGTPVAPKV